MVDERGTGPETHGDEGGGGGGGRRRIRKRKVAAWTLGVLVLLVAAAVAVLNWSGPGQRLVLDQILDRLRTSLAGELRVDRIRSSGLLGGATLIGVDLDTGDGRDFFSADSIQLRYSARGLISGDPRFQSVTVWGLRLEISKYREDQPLTIENILAEQEAAADTTSGGMTLGLGRVQVVGGLVEVLTPPGEGRAEGRYTVPNPEGEGRLNRIALRDLTLEMDQAVLRTDEPEIFRAFLASLATEVLFQEEPVVIAGGQGQVAFGPRGLTIDNGDFRLPNTLARGSMVLGPQVTEGDSWAFGVDLTTRGTGDLADLQWIDPRIPDGAFEGGAVVTVGEVLDVELRDVQIDLEASDLVLDGRFVADDGVMRFDGLAVRASPLVLSRLDPWLEAEVPVEGFVTGNMTFSGTLSALDVDGRVTLVPQAMAGGPTTADVDGTLHFGDNPGATGLRLDLDPLNYRLVERLLPGDLEPGTVPPGVGQALVRVTGRARRGIDFEVDATMRHRGETSRVVSSGSAQRSGSSWILDVESELGPFALTLLAQLLPEDVDLGGGLEGTLRTEGPLERLQVTGDLQVAEGRVQLDALINATAPESAYRVDAVLEDVALHRLTGRLPTPSRWTGRIFAEGSGFTPDSMDTRVELTARDARIGGLHVDSTQATVRVGAGILTVDTIDARLGGIFIQGKGDLGIREPVDGQVSLAFQTEDLGGLRPLLMGDTVIAGDTLRAMEATLLRFEGVDPDTLPTEAEVTMNGALVGNVTLSGSLESFSAEGEATLREAQYGMYQVDSAQVVFAARQLPSLEGVLEVDLDAYRVQLEDRAFQEVHLTGAVADRVGDARLEIERTDDERLTLVGDFALDSLARSGRVELQEARLVLDSLAWSAQGTPRIRWDTAGLEVRDLAVMRSGAGATGAMELTAEGTLSWDGDSDFVLGVQGASLDRLTRLLEMEDVELGGMVDLDLTVVGPSAEPDISGTLRWRGARYADLALDSVSGSFRYDDRSARVDLSAWEAGQEAFTTRGTVPMDLALGGDPFRSVDAPLDLRVEADSLSATVALGFLTFLEDVEGTVSGEFDVGGTLDAPEPSGVFRLNGGAWTMEAVGVRHTGIGGTLRLNVDRTVDVDLSARAEGTTRVTGTVTLEPLDDPELDLDIVFSEFQAVDRADVEGEVSGTLELVGRYRQPLVQGNVRVDEGTLFLEEFVRAAGVVDLSDPSLFDQFEPVDTTAFADVRRAQNPFLRNLRVSVDLSVPRNAWLRSPDMNVEMGGDLVVAYDRGKRNLVLVGDLEALRGSYSVLGRAFQVESGTVSFVGTPGINPLLDIEAVATIRALEDERITITANVDGTLIDPRVELTSDEPGIAQSDVVSYLIAGRPSYELTSSQQAAIRAAGSTAVTWATGALANSLGAALAQDVGLDYLNISQVGSYVVGSSVFSGTQIEVGQYVDEDVFIVLVLRPPTAQGGSNVFGGARVEWDITDDYTLEGFIEQRYLRTGIAGFRNLALEEGYIVGAFIFREWGY